MNPPPPAIPTRARSTVWSTGFEPACRKSTIPVAKEPTPGRPCALESLPASRSSPQAAAFTLIEIMVVIVIIGILAATIIPQFMTTKHEAKVSAAQASIAELANALERFHIHMDRYPSSEEGLKVLVEPPSGDEKKWRGPYISVLRPDPWGNPYQYRNPGVQRKTGFDLWSRGADNADGGEGDGADIGNW